MGIQAARSMMARLNKQEDVPLDFCFEMFAHVTKFFNYKVCYKLLPHGEQFV